MSELKDRVREAIESSGADVSNIAAACGISVQAVYKWMDGQTKMIKGDYLVELARLTGYEARWITKGLGEKKRIYIDDPKARAVLLAMQSMPEYKKDVVVSTSNTLSESEKNNGTQ